jgi:PBP1b-binding outer membrane lipoprotein LpoB
MHRFSAPSAFALAVTLLVAGCSNPVGPASSDPVGPASLNAVGPAYSQNPSASNSATQKCENSAAAQGALNMLKGKHHVDIGMANAAQPGIDGMYGAVEVSGC